jgi:genome maintenance exonuclease 1
LYDFEEFESLTLESMRLYKTPKGMIYPSVTSLLGNMKKDVLIEWRRRVGDEEANKIATQAARRGTRLHNMLEKYVANDSTYKDKAFPVELEMFHKIREVLDEHVSKIYGYEFPLYSDTLMCAGRCDLFCEYKGKPAVVDFKSSSKEKKEEWILNYFYQATAYCMMINELKSVDIQDFCIIIACEGNKVQQFEGTVAKYKDEVIQYFREQHNQQQYSQEHLQEMYRKEKQ